VTGERDRSALLLLTGAFAVWLALSGTALNFVKPSMSPYVLAAGLVTVLLAVLPTGHADEHGHDHGGGGIRWLLVVPLLVVILIPPAPLGANAISARRATARGGPGSFPALKPPVRGAVPMSMAEFQTRALRDTQRSLDGVPVRLTGFVSGRTEDGGYRLARFVIFCCAADGEAVEVVVEGDGEPRDDDQWLEVVGVWQPAGPEEQPRLRVTDVKEVGQPAQPYEYTTVWSG
jgi:uncharacterized repeat protein (TIGR03943 family)